MACVASKVRSESFFSEGVGTDIDVLVSSSPCLTKVKYLFNNDVYCLAFLCRSKSTLLKIFFGDVQVVFHSLS